MMAERDNVAALLDNLRRQTLQHFTVYCCVNNPEGWADSADPWEHDVYEQNQDTLAMLRGVSDITLKVMDCSSPGCGQSSRQRGVGWARKRLFEQVCEDCRAALTDDSTLIVSLDADTAFPVSYLQSVLATMNGNPALAALAVPYYHPLSGHEASDRAMLRYELYMRHYAISLMESGIPYCFTALGSAMVFPVWAYRRVGGITPLQGGEDFYLMQKFAKTGHIGLWLSDTSDSSGATPCCVRPQGRPSRRVPFGTGPAIAKGLDSIEDTYPFYPAEGFAAVRDTYALFPQLYDAGVETPMSAFLRQQLKTEDLWQPLRKNFRTRELFVHACKERADGLRILQYLKTFPLRTAEEELGAFCRQHDIPIAPSFSFKITSISDINNLRDAFFALECRLRKRL